MTNAVQLSSLNVYVLGDVTFSGVVTVTSSSGYSDGIYGPFPTSVITKQASDSVTFNGVINGNGLLGLSGPGTFTVNGDLGPDVSLTIRGFSSATSGDTPLPRL